MRYICPLYRRFTALAVTGIVLTMSRYRHIVVLLLFILSISFTNSSYGQCPPTITPNYCDLSDGQVRLTSSLASGNLWNTGATTQFIDVPGAGTYTVTVTGCTPPNNTATIKLGNDLVVNGNFSAGYTGFNTTYKYNPASLWTAGDFAITTNPYPTLHTSFWGYDHTHAAGYPSQNYMAVNGNPAVNKTVWIQKVKVQPNTNYYFSIWAMSVNDAGNYAELQLNINNSAVVASYVLPAGVRNNNNPWYHYYTTWNSGAINDSISISITDLQTAPSGNDFGVDDISFSSLNPASLTLSTPGSNSPVCPGNTINLTTTTSGGNAPLIYSWTGPNGFTSSSPNPTISNATVSMSGTYSVTVTDALNCSKNGSVNVSVTSGITLTASASPNSVCAGTPVNLSSSTTSSYTTTLLSENFNNATNSWIKTPNYSSGGTPANAAWTLRSDGYQYADWCIPLLGWCNYITYHSNDNSQFYLSNSHSQGTGTTRTETMLTSPVMSTVGYTSLSLDFYHYFQFAGVSNERATVEVSTNGGTSWNPAVVTYTNTQGASNNFDHPVINLDAYINNTTFQIRFHYLAFARARYWAIDNVTLSGTSNNYPISWVSNPAGFTSSVANPVNVTPLVSTNYIVTYTNTATGCSESASVPVTVQVAPVITAQPQDVSACGVAATFTVAATGATSYQWYESTVSGGPWNILTNSAPFSNVTTNALTINPIASRNGYYYHCATGNGTCPTTSNPARLTITGGAPVFSIQPVNVSKCEGEIASFTVNSDGQNFQWEVSTDGGTNFANVLNNAIYSGANNDTLTISGAILSMNLYQYRCIATIPACGSTTSNSATLNVNPLPVISAQPANIRICPNTNTAFNVVATGTIFQWQENGGAGWLNISDIGIYTGTQTSSLTLTNVPDIYNSYQYRCNISTASNCSLLSNSATLSLTIAPVISVQPTSLPICEGDVTTFSLTATSTGTLSYQWKISIDNGTTFNNISGATSSTLTLANAIGIEGTQYHCVVTDNCSQSVTSGNVILTYKPKPVTTPPANAIACADFGIFVTFTVDPLTGVTYQWQVSTNGGTTWSNLLNDAWGFELGVLSSELRVWAPDLNKNGYRYRCVLTKSSCSNPSASALLTVYQTPHYFITGTLSYCAGSSTLLTANISGTYSYEWFKDGISTGITTQSLPVSSPGAYYAKVTNTITGCFYSRIPVNVTETPSNPPVGVSITATPATPICSGTNVLFNATVSNAGVSPVYQWKKRTGANPWVNVGINSATYNDNALANGDSITCVLTANVICALNNPATSNAITMVVNPNLPVSVSILADKVDPISVCSGTSVTFTATPTNGGTTPGYQWQKNGADIPGATSAVYIDSGLLSGNVRCILTSSISILNCATGNPAYSSSITVTVNTLQSFNVTGVSGNPNCYISGAGFQTRLSGGTIGAIYTLVRDGVTNVFSTPPRLVTTAFNFPAQTLPGVYTVRATMSGCSMMMNGSTTINIPPTIALSSAAGTNNQTVCLFSPITNITYAVGGGATGAIISPAFPLPSGVTGTYNAGVFTISGTPSAPGSFNYRVETTGSGACPAVTASGNIYVNAINPGTISKGTLNPGPACAPLNPNTAGSAIAASGQGVITYSWEQSTDNQAIWQPAAGGTSTAYLTFNPDPMNVTTSLRRFATSTWNGVSCTDYSNVLTYIVYPLPIVASILPGGSPIPSVCVNAQITLTNATPSGVWSTSDALIATVSGGVVTGVSAGPVTISYTVTDGNNCSKTANRSVTVNPLPTTSAIYHQ